uniref:Acetyl-coenzyme A transporter 1 n=1 Tax=Romanomermis culicivorax TaxID=13658 RepID=A0A915L4Z3_ROMCU
MPLYAGSHHKAEKEPLVSLSTNIDEDSSAIRIRRNVELSSSGQGIISHLLTDLRGDYGNIALLVFLYILQGVPLGLTASIPLVLQNRHVSYGQQAIFSFAYWPFSLKLFWAPLVDSCYWSKIGRRKSWLIPTQYMIGLFMLILSSYVNNVLGAEEGGANAAAPNVLYLTSVFFAFNFLAATQDIAVDGWALTMLSKKNVGYASTCNAVGQTAGYFLGNVVFLALESSEFCNKYLRSEPKTQGLVTLAGDFCYYWSWIFMITTTLVLLFKRENDSISKPECSQGKIKPKDPEDLSLVDTYKLLWDIVRLKPVLLLIFIHLTAKFAFAAADGITGLKLIELGVPKDKLAFIAVPLVPLQIFLPIFIGKFTAGPTPLNVYIKAYPYRIILGLFFMLLVYWTPSFQQTDGHYPVSYYLIIIFAYCLHQSNHARYN